MDDRAATETLGFILAFAVVTTAIAIVYTAGFGGLQDARNAEQVENIERAFDVLAENFEEIRTQGVPSRATEIKLIQGDFGIHPPTNITINVTNVANTSVSIHPRPITYTSEDERTTIAYEAGALFRSDGNNTIMLSPPEWIIESGERLVIPVVDTSRTDGPTSLSGPRTILLVSQFQSESLFEHRSTSDVEVRITIESERAAAWNRFLQRKGFTGVDTNPADGEVVFTIDVERIYVPRTAIGVELTS